MTADAKTTTVQTVLPARLVAQMESLVQEGWFQDVDDLVTDAIRRYLEAHSSQLMEQYIWQDVEWGLRGTE
jgi:Arc/MetJ-type ribon-helix-helix transcriptional regulator